MFGRKVETKEEEPLRGFEIVEVPELVNVGMNDAERYVRVKFGNRIIGREEIEHISRNLEKYPEIADALHRGCVLFAFRWTRRRFRVFIVSVMYKGESGKHVVEDSWMMRQGWRGPFPPNGRVLLKAKPKDPFEGLKSTIDPLDLIK